MGNCDILKSRRSYLITSLVNYEEQKKTLTNKEKCTKTFLPSWKKQYPCINSDPFWLLGKRGKQAIF